MVNARHGIQLHLSWCKTPKPVMVQDTQTRDGARHSKPVMVQNTKTHDGARHPNPCWQMTQHCTHLEKI